MGGAVSSGESNDDLIDNLLEADYIKSPLIERVFRAVDRAFYYTDPYKQTAYKDLAWKDGNLHLSAPCIYSEVLENLEMRPGLSFLNIGSGTGYFSTMCGLILGKNGINHGIEVYPDVANYARIKLEEFQKTSPAVDEFDFCPPDFTVGNCLDAIVSQKRYDRIYCGAACPNDYVGHIVAMLKIGGICVVPLGDSLVQITRTEDTKDERKVLLPVTFATLISPKDHTARTPVELPEWSPKPLTELCRSEIRANLRQTITSPEVKSLAEESRKKKRKRRQERRRASRLVVVQRRRSGGEAEGDNGFLAIAYSMGSNSSDDEINQELDAGRNDEDGGTNANSEGVADGVRTENDGGDEDTIMEEEEEQPETSDTSPDVHVNPAASTGDSSATPRNGVAVVNGSCPIYATVNPQNGTNTDNSEMETGNRGDRRSVGTLRNNASRPVATSQSSRGGRNFTTGAESLLGRIRELVRARQHDLESMRRQFQRNSDSDNSRSPNEEVGDASDASGNENENIILEADLTSSDSSLHSVSTTSTSDDEVGRDVEPMTSKRCRNDRDVKDKGESASESKPEPLLVNACSVQMRQKILELPLPPALKVYLNYDRKLYY